MSYAVERVLLFVALVIPVVVASQVLPWIAGGRLIPLATPTEKLPARSVPQPSPGSTSAGPTATPFSIAAVQPPPTLSIAARTSSTGPAAGSGERAVVGNTDGIGAVLRSAPVSGERLAGLRDGQTLEVLGRQIVNGEEWLHVRVAGGQEGWVIGRAVLPVGGAAGGAETAPGAAAAQGASTPRPSSPEPATPSPVRRTFVVQSGDELQDIATR